MMNIDINSDRYIKTEREYRKNPASLQNLFCYTVEEIKEYINEICSSKKRAEIALHLNIDKCPRCRRLFTLVKSHNYEDRDNILERSDQDNRTVQYSPLEQKIFERIKQRQKNNITQPVPFNIKNHVEKGQIWTTSPEQKNMQGHKVQTVEVAVPVLVVDSGNGEKKLSNIIKVMPLSFDTDFHKEGETLYLGLSYYDSDLTNTIEPNPLGYPFLVEIFNERPMLAGNLLNFKTSLSKEVMERVKTLLKKYKLSQDSLSKKEADLDITKWQETEIELCHYLTLPVNQTIINSNIVEIELSNYKMAADDTGLIRVEQKATIIDNENYTFSVIQKRDMLFLRFDSPSIKPSNILIDGKAADIKATDYGEYDVEIGTIDYLLNKIAVTLTIDDKNFEFNLKFSISE